MKILYLTYDGLSDPLGRSQVIPYLMGLAEKQFDITIVSFEKRNASSLLHDKIQEKLSSKNIKWIPLIYTKRPPLFATLFDIFKLNRTCRRLHHLNKYDIVHCRSYITSFAGILLKKRKGVKFIFDMRGFYADERVEGGLWNQKSFIYRLIYRFFKEKESEFLFVSDQVVVHTHAAKSVLEKSFSLPASKITVIPCCADIQLFDPERIDPQQKQELKNKLTIHEHDFILSYLGAIGTWYLTGEMLDFFNRLVRTYPDAKFLFITHHPEKEILALAEKKNISADKLRIIRASREEVPALLALSQLSVFFILPSFSKIASSPTKQAELLSMGIPLICNTKIGDTSEIMESSGAGILIDEFTDDAYDKAIKDIPALLKKNKIEIRSFAVKRFSLESGVDVYRQIYLKTGTGKSI